MGEKSYFYRRTLSLPDRLATTILDEASRDQSSLVAAAIPGGRVINLLPPDADDGIVRVPLVISSKAQQLKGTGQALALRARETVMTTILVICLGEKRH